MATATRSGASGLSTDDLTSIRDTLAAGRRPRVMFTESAGQMAGQIGQVIELADPDLSDEWVVVRFGRDELPFSPADLSIPPRGAVKAAAAGRAARKAEPRPDPVPPGPELKIIRERPTPKPRASASDPPAPSGSSVPSAPSGSSASSPIPPSSPSSRQERAVPEVSTVESATAPAQGGAPDAEAKPARKAAKTAKPKTPPGLTVTLAYADGEWTVAAQQGTKALAKPYLIKPSEALKMVGLLDVPGVHEAVEQILAVERNEAEQRAQRLRAELADIEAKLADLR